MSKEDIEITKLTARQILMFLVDFSVISFSLAHKSPMARKSVQDYWLWRNFDKARFSQYIYRLKKQRLIRIYRDGKEKYIELTPKGFEKARKYSIDDLKIKSPKVWDKKWRIVIFDIPDTERISRNILRERLKRLGFLFLQKSVFVYPFECKKEIDYVCAVYGVRKYLKYIIADIIEGDQNLIEEFLDAEILHPAMIK